MIRLGVPADLPAASDVYRNASLSNAGDRDSLLAHPEYLVLGPEGLAGGTRMSRKKKGRWLASPPGSRPAASSNWKTLFVDPGWRRRGIAAALVNRIAQVLRARGAERLEATANLHALAFYRAAGFIDCGVDDTVFSAAPRRAWCWRSPDGSYAIRHADVSAEPAPEPEDQFSGETDKRLFCRAVRPALMPLALRISQTADAATLAPSPASSPWILRYPHSGFSRASRRIKAWMFRRAAGRPPLFAVKGFAGCSSGSVSTGPGLRKPIAAPRRVQLRSRRRPRTRRGSSAWALRHAASAIPIVLLWRGCPRCRGRAR